MWHRLPVLIFLWRSALQQFMVMMIWMMPTAWFGFGWGWDFECCALLFVAVCCCLLAVYVLVSALLVNCFVDDGLKFSSAVEAFRALVFDLAQVSKLTGVGAGAVSTEGMASNTFPPAMSTTKIFCTTSEICLHTFDFFFMAPLPRFEWQSCGWATCTATVEAYIALVFDLAQVSKLTGVGAGAVSTEGMASNTFSPAMSTTNIFCTTSEICLHTFDFFSMAPLLRFEWQSCGWATCTATVDLLQSQRVSGLKMVC